MTRSVSINALFSLSLMVLMAFTLTGCEQDDETTPTDVRYYYVGTWIATESNSKSADATYTVKITVDGTNSSQVILENYMNLGSSVRASAVVTETTITVPLQTIDSWTVSGTGTLVAESQINWSSCTANQLSTTAVYKRQ